jgi:hypothetical protein
MAIRFMLPSLPSPDLRLLKPCLSMEALLWPYPAALRARLTSSLLAATSLSLTTPSLLDLPSLR